VGKPQEIDALLSERRRLDVELPNLIDFVAKGEGASPRVRAEIRAREERLEELGKQVVRIEGTAARAPIHIDHAWVEQQMEELRQLLAADPMGARREIQKHVEDLQVAPGSNPGKRAVRITGRLKPDGLLGGEEAVRLQLVAGAGFEPATFGL
jgi:hypothetical protein